VACVGCARWPRSQATTARVRRFERESMVRWMRFDELAPGTRVVFEIEGAGGVRNVERIDCDHPDDGWTAQQFRMVVSGAQPHRWLIHDRDRIYPEGVDHR
jgi:hypothetical protein